jgi:hypothetical protein
MKKKSKYITREQLVELFKKDCPNGVAIRVARKNEHRPKNTTSIMGGTMIININEIK